MTTRTPATGKSKDSAMTKKKTSTPKKKKTSQPKKRSFKVVDYRTDVDQSEFEDDIYMVLYKIKGAWFRVYFDQSGISVHLADDLSKPGEYQMVIEPHPGINPAVSLNVK